MVFFYSLVKPIKKARKTEIWVAEDSSGRQLAIKFIRDGDEDRLVNCEIEGLKLVRSLQHPHLLKTYAYGFYENDLFVVMELANGSLLDRLTECQQAGEYFPI